MTGIANSRSDEPGSDSVVTSELLASWERQTRIMSNIAGRIGEEERGLKACIDGCPVEEHLAHIHEVRYGWLSKVSPSDVAELGEVFEQHGEEWTPIADLDEINRQLDLSAAAVGNAVRELIAAGVGKVGPYSHPIHFLQHMIWHEGYHFAVLTLALRLSGKDPGEEW